ncbi:DUF3097 domain-containing protein [Microlunatus panaciterrae]|uniref:DUF3097 domain-containing protein n=1 Tax=Microlunatus panaciterrae TaxID=400768 RepID=A0ABS2RGC3_9ACTN|nr:DUF3097 domain-containing protein [Microlunatus panaciterrae]MBM7797798.1 hypothetical protein [Microlunatus panaciterrae]
MASPVDRYARDVLSPGWQKVGKKESRQHELSMGLVVEDASTGFCGAVTRWENGLVVLEDRHGKKRSFPLGAGFLLDGQPVALTMPRGAKAPAAATRTASGSVATPQQRARVALPSRIYVEGRHDAELVEKVWGDDLRHEGVVVEYLGGIDDLPAIVADFAPQRGRRLGVLVDHLVPGSKESRIAEQVRSGHSGRFVHVTGHPFIDIWQAVKPARVGLEAWPQIPRDVEWKHGICAHLGWPHADQADIAKAWQLILSRVDSWTDLETALLTRVEELIDFVTQDHVFRD